MVKTHTTITVKNATWKKLNLRRDPGESMDDVIDKMALETPEVKK
jgi:hypothetical protein